MQITIIGGTLEDKVINKRVGFFKFLLFGAILGILIFIFIKIFPFIKDISTRDGQEAFREYITSLGVKGTLLLFLLQIVSCGYSYFNVAALNICDAVFVC